MNAVIYCRVSSREQVDGTSLESQEAACREFAARRNLIISGVFIEEGESAKFADRTQLLELMAHCKIKSHKIGALIVWKIDRFARNVEDHFTIKATLRKLGVEVVSVTEPIQSDPNGKLLETILAGFAQFDNEIRTVRTVQGMQQRLRDGIFPWRPPIGYCPPRTGKKTQPDQRDPSRFTSIQKAWKLFASGGHSKMDILRLLRTWGVTGYRGEPIVAQTLDNIFCNGYYAGILKDPWTGAEYVGRHEAMVTKEEFARVQTIIEGRNRSIRHRRVREEFPLRGIVRCPSCELRMTGSFCKGRTRKYPYYQCFRRGCPTRTRNHPVAAIHAEFMSLLAEMSFSLDFATALEAEIASAFADQNEARERAGQLRRTNESRIQQQIDELVSMRASRLLTDEEFVKQRQRLRKRLFTIQATAADQYGAPQITSEDIKTLVASLADLPSVWSNCPISIRRTLTELLLPDGFVFGRIRTAKTGLLFKATDANPGPVSHLAAFVRANLNQLLHEIRKLLSLFSLREDFMTVSNTDSKPLVSAS